MNNKPLEREPMNNEPFEREPIDRMRARLEALLKANAAPRREFITLLGGAVVAWPLAALVAKSLGLTIPPGVLAIADEVIE